MAFTFMLQFIVAEQHVEAFKEASIKLESHGKNAPGAIRFEYYQSKEDPTKFINFAIWESAADSDRFAKSEAHVEIGGALPEGTILEFSSTDLQALS